MELLTGYMSSDEDINKDDKNSPRPSLPPSGKSTLQRPLAGSVNAAPLLFVPMAVLRSKGLLSGGPVALSTGSNLRQLAVQGPTLLNDPNDAVASFVCAIDPKTGSTTKIAADAAADEFIFAKNRNAFQRGPNNDQSRHDAALAPGEMAVEIQRNEYGHDRHFPPNYGVVPRRSQRREKTKKTATTTEMMRRNRSSLQCRDKTTSLPAANVIHSLHSMQTKNLIGRRPHPQQRR